MCLIKADDLCEFVTPLLHKQLKSGATYYDFFNKKIFYVPKFAFFLFEKNKNTFFLDIYGIHSIKNRELVTTEGTYLILSKIIFH